MILFLTLDHYCLQFGPTVLFYLGNEQFYMSINYL